MITRILHWLMAQPRVYDLVQNLVGANKLRQRLLEQTSKLAANAVVVDLGGGTGLMSTLWPASTCYICLDTDTAKLCGFLRRHPGGIALLADAARMPIADASLDAVLCTSMSHHLETHSLLRMFGEVTRALKPGGKFIFLDAVWKPTRWPGRVIWHFDRGSFPRTSTDLQAMIGQTMRIDYSERIAIVHEYFMCVATPLASLSDQSTVTTPG